MFFCFSTPFQVFLSFSAPFQHKPVMSLAAALIMIIAVCVHCLIYMYKWRKVIHIGFLLQLCRGTPEQQSISYYVIEVLAQDPGDSS